MKNWPGAILIIQQLTIRTGQYHACNVNQTVSQNESQDKRMRKPGHDGQFATV